VNFLGVDIHTEEEISPPRTRHLVFVCEISNDRVIATLFSCFVSPVRRIATNLGCCWGRRKPLFASSEETYVPRFPRNRCLLDVTCRRFHETASNPLYRQHYEVKLNTFANIQHILLCWIPVFHDSPYHVVHMDYLVGSRHGT